MIKERVLRRVQAKGHESLRGHAANSNGKKSKKDDERNNQATPLGIVPLQFTLYTSLKEWLINSTFVYQPKKGCKFSKLQIRLVITFNYD